MTDPKPPLDIKPKVVWLQYRAADLAGTISRYLNSGTLTPRMTEWMAELNEIVAQLYNEHEEAVQSPPLSTFGFRIWIKYTLDGKDHTKIVVLRNVDSITSKYEPIVGKILIFSSSIHEDFSQCTVNGIAEWQATIETEKAEKFR